MDYLIRRASFADAPQIAQNNIAAAWESEGMKIHPETALAGVLSVLTDEHKGIYRVVEVNGKIVAQLMTNVEWSDWRNRPIWWIQSVYVVAEFRKNGYFRLLYEHVLAEAKVNQVVSVKLYADKHNLPAIAVYRALGMSDEHYSLFEINL
jgi:ribosomal protein S18 acetylase RimI-like enzyme